MSLFLLFAAGRTCAPQKKVIAANHQIAGFLEMLDALFQKSRARQIQNLSAFHAQKMIVRIQLSIKMLLPVNNPQRTNGAILFKTRKIPINRSQAQIRVLVFQLLINPFGRRVDI